MDQARTQNLVLPERLTLLDNQAELELSHDATLQGGNNRASINLAAQIVAINIFKLESEGVRVLAMTSKPNVRPFDL